MLTYKFITIQRVHYTSKTIHACACNMRKYQAIYSSGVSIIEIEHVNTSWIAGGNRKAFKKHFTTQWNAFYMQFFFRQNTFFNILGIYLLKVNNRNTRTSCDVLVSFLFYFASCSTVSNVNFEHAIAGWELEFQVTFTGPTID